jgi:hypothetical protein
MVEAATNHAYRAPDLRGFELRIARRRGIKIARVALARRLLTLCFYALRARRGAVSTRRTQHDLEPYVVRHARIRHSPRCGRLLLLIELPGPHVHHGYPPE